ncbi:MAG: aminoglycoside phosphotransferase family protein [Anaerolineae bacterium]|nr:MAG: aminoglycoside phosphotransferase [Chloroflexi bacterium OLB13]MBW7881004.1 aminoglycoside phosphotransferase family protein [Anaerolineae bacterium]
MLEKPDIDDALILACLRDAFGIDAHTLSFLPIGADANTAVYRAEAADVSLFVKLRRGDYNAAATAVPKALHDAGVAHVIAPIPNQHGALTSPVADGQLAVFPFIVGHDGWTRVLTASDWVTFGRALKQFHTTPLPAVVTAHIARETYDPAWRDKVTALISTLDRWIVDDPVTYGLADLLRERRWQIESLISHARHLAGHLRSYPPPQIVCHGDIHVGNVLITPDGMLYLVDWDTLVYAPKERDLMFVGAGLGSSDPLGPDAQAALFYEGYGTAQVDLSALAYYRCERIVEDIAAYCDLILLTLPDNTDRANGLAQLASQFAPGSVVDIALATAERPLH